MHILFFSGSYVYHLEIVFFWGSEIGDGKSYFILPEVGDGGQNRHGGMIVFRAALRLFEELSDEATPFARNRRHFPRRDVWQGMGMFSPSIAFLLRSGYSLIIIHRKN